MHRSRAGFAVGLLLVVATVFVYGRVGGHAFVNYDDPVYVYEKPMVQRGLSADGVRWAFTTFDCSNWHPLTWLSLMLDCSLFGAHPGRLLQVNLVLHILNTLLLFYALRRMTAALWRPALVAGLFALHPLHVESVAWISERKDVLSALFWLLAMVAYVRYVERPSVGRYALVFTAMALGLMAKPMLVTLPCALLLLDWWPLGRWTPLTPHPSPPTGEGNQRTSPRWLLLEKLPLFLLSAASCVVTVFAQEEALNTLEKVSIRARVMNTVVAYAEYLRKMVWPNDLACFYPHPKESVPMGEVLLAAGVLLAITLFAVALARRYPYLLVGWLWYLGTLIPVIGLVQVGAQAMADRYTYIPLIGVFIMIAWGMADLAGCVARVYHPCEASATTADTAVAHKIRILAGGLAVAALVACMATARQQVGTWRENETLWQHCITVAGEHPLPYASLSAAALEKQDPARALEYADEALRMRPAHAQARTNKAVALLRLGRLPEAEAVAVALVEEKPELAGMHNTLGVIRYHLGRPEEAVAAFREAARRKPDAAMFHYNLGMTLAEMGSKAEAETAFAVGRKWDAKHPLKARQAAKAQATKGPFSYGGGLQALFAAKVAWYADGEKSAESADVLAAALARLAVEEESAGRKEKAAALFAQAVAMAENALELARRGGREEAIPAIEERRALYRQGKAYEE